MTLSKSRLRVAFTFEPQLPLRLPVFLIIVNIKLGLQPTAAEVRTNSAILHRIAQKNILPLSRILMEVEVSAHTFIDLLFNWYRIDLDLVNAVIYLMDPPVSLLMTLIYFSTFAQMLRYLDKAAVPPPTGARIAPAVLHINERGKRLHSG